MTQAIGDGWKMLGQVHPGVGNCLARIDDLGVGWPRSRWSRLGLSRVKGDQVHKVTYG